MQINGNSAQLNGGGVYNVSAGDFTMNGGYISANHVLADNGFGGGLFNAGDATLSTVTVQEDNEANRGAGIYLAGDSTTSLQGVLVQGNELIGNNPLGQGIYVVYGGQLHSEGLNDADDPEGQPVYGS